MGQRNTGERVTVKSLKVLQATPGVQRRRKYHRLFIEGEVGVFLPSLMQHLCGKTYTVEGINSKGKYIIHDEAGNVFTLTEWMVEPTTQK